VQPNPPHRKISHTPWRSVENFYDARLRLREFFLQKNLRKSRLEGSTRAQRHGFRTPTEHQPHSLGECGKLLGRPASLATGTDLERPQRIRTSSDPRTSQAPQIRTR